MTSMHRELLATFSSRYLRQFDGQRRHRQCRCNQSSAGPTILHHETVRSSIRIRPVVLVSNAQPPRRPAYPDYSARKHCNTRLRADHVAALEAMYGNFQETVDQVFADVGLIDIRRTTDNEFYKERTAYVPKIIMGKDSATGSNQLTTGGINMSLPTKQSCWTPFQMSLVFLSCSW